MKTKLLGCLAATAMAVTVVVATAAMAFHGGGGSGGGGFHGGFGGGGFRGGTVTGRSMFVPVEIAANKTKLRLTNLMNLIVDTSWWTRYRSRDFNPDLGDPQSDFPQAVPSLFIKGKPHPAIPRTDADTIDKNHIQAIANTAAFHFGFIEQGGTSLYPTLALRVTDPVVLRILLSIGPTETMHFQTWHDKAGNAFSPPNNVTFGDLTFNVSTSGEDLQTNLIMPEPCPFLNRKFPVVSVIRPVSTSTSRMTGCSSANPKNSLRSCMTLRRMPMRRRASVIVRISAKA